MELIELMDFCDESHLESQTLLEVNVRETANRSPASRLCFCLAGDGGKSHKASTYIHFTQY